MRRSIFFSFACIDLKFCKQPPDHCRIINHGLDFNYKVRSCACADLSFLVLHKSTSNFLHSFLFVPITISQAWVCSFHTTPFYPQIKKSGFQIKKGQFQIKKGQFQIKKGQFQIKKIKIKLKKVKFKLKKVKIKLK